MKNLIKITSALFCILLVGCTTFGIDNKTWSTLSPSEREIAMKNYYRNQEQQQKQQAEINKIDAQNAPLNNAIALLGDVATQQGNTTQKCVTDEFNKTVCGHNCYVDQFGNGHCAA